jgi:Arylsulfotransferase (ASST)
VVALLVVAPLATAPIEAGAQVPSGCTAPPSVPASSGGPIGGFNPVTPVRLLDTRPTGKVGAGCVVSVDVSSVAPVDAAGIALNVTATEAESRGFVTAFPCGSGRTLTSNVNPRVGDPTPNLVVVALDASRTVCLFTFAPTNLIVDATGWFGGDGDLFHEQAPQRVVDTRVQVLPEVLPPKLAAGSVLTIPLAGSAAPAAAKAVAVNLTVTEPNEAGYVTAYPCGTAPPLSSQVNFLPGENRANQSMVGLGGGALCVFVFTATHLVVDIAGWFGPGDGGVPLQPIAAARLVDSRSGVGGATGPLAPGETRVIDPSASGALPPGAHDLLLNVVATQAAAPGFLTVYPCKQGRPATSSVNYTPGNEATNLVTVPLDGDGRICVYAFERTQLVIDLLGTFGAPGTLRQLQVGGLALDPPFRPDIHDYSLHCKAGSNTITYAATAMPGTTLSVNNVAAGTDTSGSALLAADDALVITAGPEQYWARCLPADFPLLTVKTAGTVAPGYYLMEDGVASGAGRFVMILDTNGVPVWYRRVPASIDFKQLPDGNLAWINFVRPNFNLDLTKRYEEHTLDGTLVRTIGAGPTLATDYHDMIPLTDGSGDAIVLAYSLRTVPSGDIPSGFPTCGTGTEVIDAILQRVAADGSVVWTWNSKDHTDLNESVPVCDVSGISGSTATNAYDLLHLNSIDVDPVTGDLFLGARYMNAVLRVSQTTGTVLWKIGGYTDTNHDGAIHFSVLGDPLGTFDLAHDVRLNPGGHLTMFDNRANATKAGKMRAVEYAIDATAHTISFVWQRPIDGPCTNPACKSFGLGSVRRQPDGNTVIAWGGEPSPAFSEVDPEGTSLLDVSLPGGSLTYRVVKVAATAFNLDQLHANVSS